MKTSLVKPLLALACLLPALAAGAGRADVDVSSTIDLEARTFAGEPRWPGQDDARAQLSIAATVELRWRGAGSRASLIPFLRHDATDDERSLADLREAYWAREGDAWELLVGVNRVFWGVTESAHLVDIVNQTDALADIDGEDKLGQPMINLELQRDWGRVGVYLLPGFRERGFAGVDGRLRTPLPVDADHPRYESADGERHVDLALRYGHYVGSVDIGLSAFSGTSREPRLLPNADGSALVPVYDRIDQFGLDLQVTGDAWLWKLEAIYRETRNDTFGAAVGGFEYTRYQVAGSAADVGLLLEGQYDGRARGEPVTLADNDLFAGLRLALNDPGDSTLLAGLGYDLESGETWASVEAGRRLGDDFVLELRARMFARAEPGDASYPIEADDYLQLRLSRYF